MRIRATGETLMERMSLRSGMVPTPLLETQMAFTLARVIMVGTRAGIFEALAGGPLTAQEIAARCGTDPRATGKLLFALAGSRYLDVDGGRYSLAPVARKWLLRDSPDSLADKMLFQFLEWDFLGRAEDYVRSGQPLELHSTEDPEAWDLYQRGMRALASPFAREGVDRIPVPSGARDMLDIGGSHGFYSVAMCRRYPHLRAVVLDLPAAVERAAPLLAREGMADRVVHRAGDALKEDLGRETYDLVLLGQLAHHFSDAQNRDLAGRVARALRPGGVYAIAEAVRPEDPRKAGQIGALLDFYFALTSQSGTWSVPEMAGWQKDAGLSPMAAIFLRTLPGVAIQAARKPSTAPAS
jgi:SAM-dependent methyltransferase